MSLSYLPNKIGSACDGPGSEETDSTNKPIGFDEYNDEYTLGGLLVGALGPATVMANERT